MKPVKLLGLGMAGLLILLMAGLWMMGPKLHGKGKWRRLTPSEMARVFGRQGGPPCDGCWLEYIGTGDCTGTDPCECKSFFSTTADKDMPKCAVFGFTYTGLNKLGRHRPQKMGEPGNKLAKYTTQEKCWDRYTCIQGVREANLLCILDDEGKCGGFAAVSDCRSCTEGGWLETLRQQDDYCECPK